MSLERFGQADSTRLDLALGSRGATGSRSALGVGGGLFAARLLLLGE